MFSIGRFSVTNFLKTESAGGMLLIAAAILAMIVANTSLFHYYEAFIDLHFKIQLGDFIKLDKPMHLWINDGLMAFFFLLVGLELKREMIEGELSNKDNVILPAIGAVGGMAVPALIYVAFNMGNSDTLRGWAIPSATDIAFALGVLSLLGPRVPVSLKLFLTSLAIFDDIGAIIIIAVFYTSNLSMAALSIAALCVVALAVMNYLHVESKPWYFLVGAIMWVAILKSGVHATLAGVLLAMFIPMYAKDGASGISPLKSLEHGLHGFVAFFILPVFAFANSGISFSGMTMDTLLHPVPVGIGVGLFLGNQFGIFSICWLAIKMGFTRLPDGMNWKSLYGTATLCGIGFTMSLFISSLAFFDAGNIDFDPRVGIMLGSLLSGVLGYVILRMVLPEKQEPIL